MQQTAFNSLLCKCTWKPIKYLPFAHDVSMLQEEFLHDASADFFQGFISALEKHLGDDQEWGHTRICVWPLILKGKCFWVNGSMSQNLSGLMENH